MAGLNFENVVMKPIFELVGLIILLAVYSAFLPTIFVYALNIANNANMGIFGSVLAIVIPIVIGAVFLYVIILKLMKLIHTI